VVGCNSTQFTWDFNIGSSVFTQATNTFVSPNGFARYTLLWADEERYGDTGARKRQSVNYAPEASELLFALPDTINCTNTSCVATLDEVVVELGNPFPPFELRREWYVNTEDTESRSSWVRMVNSYTNNDDVPHSVFFSFGGQFDYQYTTLRCPDGDTIDSVSCDELGTYYSPRAAIYADQSRFGNILGFVHQGTPPADLPVDNRHYFFAAQPQGFGQGYVLAFSRNFTVAPNQTISEMYFLIQAGPWNIAPVVEDIGRILAAPREFYDGDDVSHPFYGLSEETWATIVNWNAGAVSVGPLVFTALVALFTVI